MSMSGENLSSAMALLIPLLSVTVSFAALIVWIVMWYRRRMREADCRHKERMAAIERGLELPAEAPLQTQPMPPRSRYLLRGLIWLGVGLAITLGAQGWLGNVVGAGWIAVAVGAAYLIFYFVEGRRAVLPERDAPASDGDQTP
jgi:Domain of unknown function (DUF6249)